MKIGVGPLWIEAFPFKKFRERRARKRAERTGQAVPVVMGEGMNEQIASVLRTVIKSAGGSLVGAGIVTDGQMEILAGAAAIIIGMAWSWWVKRKAPATAG